MSLALNNVHVSILGNSVLRGISINVEPGELVCLVGRNGAGKTTTIRSIMGFQQIQQGKIFWNTKSIIGMTAHQIARLGLGYTPEGSDVFGDLTVEDNIALPTWTRKTKVSAQARIDEAYAVFPKLRQYLHRGGQQLSGGERKMVSIARALALDPDMLLLDEAFEGLSPAIIPTISTGLQHILKRGRAVLLAESNFYHLPRFADRLYVIERGEIIFEGTVAQVENDAATMRVIKGTD
ncbi:ABC transporter ATP-binding protein [Noviherbaspirillum sp. CPCC 100848]|jgi:branched-chain amino acid transport system ATP-binding protein|uniref:ABC transporter ATP-binding protein n=1 Tax=Noviherbaspirillum album TaxID=3080276 RepID=A0ABU6J4R1_9BURK|nr:ABC transporter ATP-binding protein [Noviherbaspirillum sp. CPCC 100848]MEC4718332.1 ABC transporter ATP-binding protein [Noviherbaspirillum sp. CPCC 100848]